MNKASVRACLFTLIFIAAQGCKVRNYNARVKSTGGSVPLDYAEPLVDASLLKDDPAFPPSEHTVDSVIDDAYLQPGYLPTVAGARVTEMYVGLLQADSKPKGWVAAENKPAFQTEPWDILAYEKLIIAAGRKPPAPLAAESVLQIMQKNRKEFALNVEGGKIQKPLLLGIKLPTLNPSMEATASDQSLFFISDSTKPFSKTKCGGIPVDYYSDIRYHYYCQIPSIFRACHRNLIGQFYNVQLERLSKSSHTHEELEQLLGEALLKDRAATVQYCLDPSSIQDSDVKAAFDAAAKSSGKFMAVFGMTFEDTVDAFKKFYESQYLELSNGKKVNMFDYLMNSQTYAFDFKQQQAVLNYFYGQMKPANSGAFDPLNPTDCQTYREPRDHEKTLGGKHCDASVPRKGAYVSH